MKEKKRQQFRKAVKIKRSRELYRVLSNGHRSRNPVLTVYSLENEMNCARCAVIVSSKTGSAVDRNTLKRHVREWFRMIPEPLYNRDILIKFNAVRGAINKKAIDEALRQWYHTEKKLRH